MKLVVFAHTPPPHHGQSYMVELMLKGLGGDVRKSSAQDSPVQCYHVNARVSDGLNDVGSMRPGKLLRFVGYCFEAIWCRVRYGADTLYYVPAPAKKSAILRDWLVMCLVRPWFAKTIFHWHAFGLGYWAAAQEEKPSKLEGYAIRPPVLFGRFESLARTITKGTMSGVDLSIALTDYNCTDSNQLSPQRSAVVPNGIHDPCQDFATAVLPARIGRLSLRSEGARALEVLYLAHCIREKGLFDTLEAVVLAHGRLQEKGSSQKIHLTVAGEFMSAGEKEVFLKRLEEIQAQGVSVEYVGFLDAVAKDKALRYHDVLCFPTFYPGETFGVTILEAMAYGMPFVTTRFRGLGEVAPPDWPYLISVGDVSSLAASLLEVSAFADFACLRTRFLENYVDEQTIRGLRQAMLSV